MGCICSGWVGERVGAALGWAGLGPQRLGVHCGCRHHNAHLLSRHHTAPCPAEVVEVVRYRGPVNATIIKRHQQWLDAAQVCRRGRGSLCRARGGAPGAVGGLLGACSAAALCHHSAHPTPATCQPPALSQPAPPLQTRTARHKIAKFLRQHAALAVSKGMPAPPSSTLGQGPPAASADTDARQVGAGLGDTAAGLGAMGGRLAGHQVCAHRLPLVSVALNPRILAHPPDRGPAGHLAGHPVRRPAGPAGRGGKRHRAARPQHHGETPCFGLAGAGGRDVRGGLAGGAGPPGGAPLPCFLRVPLTFSFTCSLRARSPARPRPRPPAPLPHASTGGASRPASATRGTHGRAPARPRLCSAGLQRQRRRRGGPVCDGVRAGG